MTVFVDGTYSRECSLSAGALAKFLRENSRNGVPGCSVDVYRSVRLECGEEAADGRRRMVMSTGDLDRDKEKIDQGGWLLDNYRRNPVILWSHDWSVPAIGYMAEIEAGRRLSGVPVFNDREFDPFGWGIGQRLLKGSLSCGSVGFRVLEAEVVNHRVNPEETADVIYRKQELLEFSICNIPANPFARAGTDGKGMGMYDFLRTRGL